MKVPKSPGYKIKFQSTLPVWGATPQFWTLEVAMERFQSTLPVWGATKVAESFKQKLLFQSTLPIRERPRM